MSGVPAIVIRAAAWNALPLLSLPFGVYVIMSESIPSLLFLVALGVLTMLGQAMFFSRMLRLRRRLREASGRICLKCGFDLRGLEESGTCPECGRSFDLHRDVKTWRSVIAFDVR